MATSTALISVDIVTEILLHVDDSSLWQCLTLNRTFKLVLTSQSFWMRRCSERGIEYPKMATLKQYPDCNVENIDYCRIYWKKPYGRNLIKNPSGEYKLGCWKKLMSGGDGFRVEHPPDGSDTEGFPYCFATSYGWCGKQQVVDLLKEGCDAWMLDNLQPKICVSEWTAARFDCGSVHILRVLLQRSKMSQKQKDFEFLNEYQFHNHDFFADHSTAVGDDPQVVAHFQEPTVVQQWDGRAWKETIHVFENYGPGVRYVVFQSFGKDLQFWKDWYGPKMAKASVILTFD